MPQSATRAALPSGQSGDQAWKPGPASALRLAQDLVDLCLAERVAQALRASGYPPLHAIEVSVRDQVVILQGCVPSYYLKQLAQTVAMETAGVRNLRNDVQVVRLARSGGGGNENEDTD